MVQTQTSYQQQLRSPRWQRRRLEILQRDAWCCRRCGATENELHVHHRWYGRGAPWEVPDAALVSICDACHQEIHMASHVPIIAQRYALTGDYGPIPTCVTQDRRRYIARQPLITQVARKCGRNPDSLWAVYLRADGGESFREVLRQDLGAQGVVDVDPLIQFEADGIVWLLQRLAVHFVAQYDPTLEYTIYKNFDETALTPPGSASPNASPVASRSRPAGPLDVLMGMLQEMMGHRDTLDRHENLHAQ